MHEPDLARISDALSAIGVEHGGRHVSGEETIAFVRDLFFGSRQLWHASEVDGIITRDELVSALLDRYLHWVHALTASVPHGTKPPWGGATALLHEVLFEGESEDQP